MQKKVLSTVKYIIYIGVIMVLTLPSLVLTLYSYPVQDDFHMAYYGRELMQQGHNLLTMALIKTWDYYRMFSGYYTCSFLGWFFSGAINCSVWGIRIFELLTAIFFYVSIWIMLRSIITRVMGYDKKRVLPFYILLLLCVNGLVIYGEHEDFYWFTACVMYLTTTSFIFYGVSLFLRAIDTKSKKSAVEAAVFGFLGSGGALNIAALCCILYLLVAVWGFFVKKEKVVSGIVFGVTLAGGIMNGLAPGNFIRAGEPLTISKIIDAMTGAFVYAFSRIAMFLQHPIYVAVVIILVIYLLMCRSKNSDYRFNMPILFTVAAFSFVAVIIFPVMMGYGKEVYHAMCRSNFISDIAIYLFTFLTLFYWRGWLERRFPHFAVTCRLENAILIVSALVLVVIIGNDRLLWKGNRMWKTVPFVRETWEWYSGRYREYSDYCIGVYDQIKEAEGDIVEITIREVKDTTCMINPQFWIGYYDMDKEHANRSIANFYGKDAVYIYLEE